MSFPENFLWGAASSAPQIEGAWDADDRTPSIWDIASEKKIKNGENCRTGCDHYRRFREDIALMKEIGLARCLTPLIPALWEAERGQIF